MIPACGSPELLSLDAASAKTVEITIGAEEEPTREQIVTRNIYFNRRVAGSQAYAVKYGRMRYFLAENEHPAFDAR